MVLLGVIAAQTRVVPSTVSCLRALFSGEIPARTHKDRQQNRTNGRSGNTGNAEEQSRPI